MSVLILFGGSLPNTGAGAKRVGLYKKGLLKAGTTTDIVRFKTIGSGRMGFYLYSFLLPFRATRLLFKLRKKYGVVLVYGFGWLTYLCLASASWLCSTKPKIVLEINEKIGTVYSNWLLEQRWLKMVDIVLTRFTYRFFDGFVVISTALETDIKRYMKRGASLIKVPILVDPESDLAQHEKPSCNNPYILHAGALSDQKDGIVIVLNAFSMVCRRLDKQLHFYLTSSIAPRDVWASLKQIIVENGIEGNVHFLGDIPEETLQAYQKHCLLTVIYKPNNEQNRFNFPTKLGEFMAYGKPVITTGIGELVNYLVDGENAFFVSVDQVNQLADKILYVIQHPNESAAIGNNGKATAARLFSYVEHGKRMAFFFKELEKVKSNAKL